MEESAKTSGGPERPAEQVRDQESPERTAERLSQVAAGEAKSRFWRSEGDADLAETRMEAPAVLDKIEPAGSGSAERDDGNASAARRAAELAIGRASRPDLLRTVRELAGDAEDGTEPGASQAALLRIAADPKAVPEGLDARAARDWASAAAHAKEAAAQLREADRKADLFLARLREANPAAAKSAEAEFAAYASASAGRGDALDKRGFMAGWYAANAESVAAGVTDPAKREALLADIAGLAATRGEAVDRYLRELAPGKARRMAEASLAAQRDLVGAAGDGPAPVKLEDGRTAIRGDRGWLLVGPDGRTQALDGEGKVLAAFDAARPGVTLAGRTGYPVPNSGADAGKVAREGRAVNAWEDALSERGMGFLTGGQLKRFEDALSATAAHRGGRQVRLTDAPTPRALEDALAAMERMLGFKPGEVFNPDDGMRLRMNRGERGFPEDMAPFLRNRMAENGLVTLGGGLAFDLAVAAIGRSAEPGNAQ